MDAIKPHRPRRMQGAVCRLLLNLIDDEDEEEEEEEEGGGEEKEKDRVAVMHQRGCCHLLSDLIEKKKGQVELKKFNR